ncbi:MAG: lipid A-modifier LpxR family protein, partial [Pseudomonadota bacterium]
AQGSFGQSGLAWEMTPVLGASFGTVAANVRGGGMVRFGTDLSSHFGPARIRPSLTSTAHFDRQRAFTWYAFAGAQGRVVAHDIFLDGSLLRDNSPSVEKNTVVTDMQAGIALNLGPAQLSFTYLRRSERFETQEGADGFGGLTLSFKR